MYFPNILMLYGEMLSQHDFVSWYCCRKIVDQMIYLLLPGNDV